MIRLALFIEGERVDLFEDTSVVIKDKIKTADDIGTLFTQYTRPFKLPASKTNNKIFKHWYSPYTVESFDARKKHSAIITLNGSDYRKGYVKLIDAELKDNKIHAYNVQFFGELTTLKDRMGDDILSDINYFNQFNHEFSLTNVKNGFENGLSFNLLTSPPTITTSSDGQIIYPFISHTNGFQYNATNGLLNLDTASPASPTDSTDRLAKEDLKPAIRLTSILDGIESEYGISFEGDFLESDAFTELFLWCHRNKGGLTTDDPTTNQPTYTYRLQQFGNNVTFTKADSDPVGFDCNVWDQEPDVSLGMVAESDWDKYIDYGFFQGGNVAFDPDDIHDFIVYDVGFYPGEKITEYEVDLTITPAPAFSSSYVVVVRNSYTDEIYHQEPVAANQNFNATIDIKADFNGKEKVDLEVIVVSNGLDEFDIDATITANRKNGVADETRIWTYSDTVTSAQLITEAKVGFNLPKIKVIDFLRGLFKMFNLVAYAEQNLVTGQWKLFVEPYQEFLKNGRTFDITRYVDIESSKMERITPYSSLEFDFEDKKTFIALKTDELSKFDFGSLRWDANQYGQGELLYDGGNYEVKVPFEKPVYERIVDSANDLTEIIYGWFVNDFSENEPEPELGAPLIFYRVQRSFDDDEIVWSDSSTTNTTYNAPSNVISDESQTINFGAEIDEYTYAVNENSLFANFYKDYIAASYAITARRYKVSAYLPYEFLHTYKLNDVLSINSQNYYMQEVSFDLMTGKAELDLLRIVPPNDNYSIAAQKPVSSTYADYNYVDDGYWGSGYNELADNDYRVANPLVWYKFENSYQDTESGVSTSLALGSEAYVKGADDSLAFDFATTELVQATGAHNTFAGDVEFSVGCDVNLDAVGSVQTLISKQAASNYEYQLKINTSNKIEFRLYTDSSNYIGKTSASVLSSSNWYSIAVTYDGSETEAGIKIYLDGVLETMTTNSSGTYTGMGTAEALTLGYQEVSGTEQYLNGKMDNVRIWNYELPLADVQSVDNS